MGTILHPRGAVLTTTLPGFVTRKPWIDPDAAEPERIIETIKRCPSGALSYTLDGEYHMDQDRDASISIGKDGPYKVVGGPSLEDPGNSGTKPVSKEHYALCRCGRSKNKPFCDGSHRDAGFKDEKN